MHFQSGDESAAAEKPGKSAAAAGVRVEVGFDVVGGGEAGGGEAAV